jgi:hypothetical protein
LYGDGEVARRGESRTAVIRFVRDRLPRRGEKSDHHQIGARRSRKRSWRRLPPQWSAPPDTHSLDGWRLGYNRRAVTGVSLPGRSNRVLTRIALAGVGFLIAFAGPQIARAQAARTGDALINRPSLRGPSSAVGGQYTSGSFRTLAAPRADVSTLGENRFQFTRPQRNGRGRDLRQVMPITQQGFSSPLAAPAGWSLSNFADRTGELAMISGLEAATSLYLPLLGQNGNLPALDSFRHMPKFDRTPHETFFGLTPAADSTPAPAPISPVALRPGQVELTSYAAALEQETQRRVAAASAEGIAAFRNGTREVRDAASGRFPSCATCEAELFRALQRLTLARSMNSSDYVAPLLMGHISLERERPAQAIVYLVNAYERHPTLLEEGPAFLQQYFGDSEEGRPSRVLQAQLRRYLRIGEINAGSPEALVLEAYCAWGLGDAGRTRDAVERYTKTIARTPDMAPVMTTFIEALRAAAR